MSLGFLVWQVPLPPLCHPVAEHTRQTWHSREDGKGVFQQGVGREAHHAVIPGSRHTAINVSHFATTLTVC